jgi:hypothetical protein
MNRSRSAKVIPQLQDHEVKPRIDDFVRAGGADKPSSTTNTNPGEYPGRELFA